MDMLVLKSCNTEKFKRVLCLNFGRNPTDFEEIHCTIGDNIDLRAHSIKNSHSLHICYIYYIYVSKADNREVGWWCSTSSMHSSTKMIFQIVLLKLCSDWRMK